MENQCRRLGAIAGDHRVKRATHFGADDVGMVAAQLISVSTIDNETDACCIRVSPSRAR